MSKIKSLSLFLVLSLFPVAALAQTTPIEVAITVDDLPTTGKATPAMSRLEMANEVIRVLKEAGVPGAMGFVNGATIEGFARQVAVVKAWKAAGFPLGNHGFSHLSLDVPAAGQAQPVDVQTYINDITKNEKYVSDYMGGAAYQKFFRYPFLQEGATQERRTAVRTAITGAGYKVAQVTIDFKDWYWNDPYVRCYNKNNPQAEASIAAMKQQYIQNAVNQLKGADRLGKFLYRRPVKQILLLHMNSTTTDWLKDLIAAYKAAGVTFIPFETAAADPAYATDPNQPTTSGQTYFMQVRTARDIDDPTMTIPPVTTQQAQLANLCL